MSQMMSPADLSDVRERELPESLRGITLRAVVIAGLLTVATWLGITRIGYISLNWVPYVVPPVPAILFLLVLVGVNAGLWTAWRRSNGASIVAPLSRGELLLIYASIAAALPMERAGYVFHYLLFPKYYGSDVDGYVELFEHYPAHWVPHEAWVVRGFFEGTAAAQIPWDQWIVPLAWWGTFSLVLVFSVLCLSALFRRQWSENERLTYPMNFLPLEITGGFSGSSSERSFFRNPIMWIGFAAATLFNGINIMNAFFPGFPSIDRNISVTAGITDPPWRWLHPLNFSFSLEVWGLSYLMSGEVLGTALATYLLMKMVKMGGLSAGYRAGGFPFYQEVSAGACIAFTFFMLWVARPHLRRIARSVFTGPTDYDHGEAMSYRAQTIGLLLGTVTLIVMLQHAGMRWWLALAFFASLYLFTLVAARIRAEAGPPVLWTHPYGFDTIMPIHLLGTRAIRGLGTPQSMVLFYSLFWIGRTVFAHSTAQAFTDGLKLPEYVRAHKSSFAWLMLGMCALGLMLTYWYHLDVGYTYGQGLIGARTGRAGQSWALNWSRGNYRLLDQAMGAPEGPDWTRIGFYAGGAALTAAVTWMRTIVSSFPFHPLGIILGTLYGDGSPYWAPFLVAWVAQRITLRYGSLPAYRKVVPAFLGLFFGHVLVGGILWRIVINFFIDPLIAVRYYLNLGG